MQVTTVHAHWYGTMPPICCTSPSVQLVISTVILSVHVSDDLAFPTRLYFQLTSPLEVNCSLMGYVMKLRWNFLPLMVHYGVLGIQRINWYVPIWAQSSTTTIPPKNYIALHQSVKIMVIHIAGENIFYLPIPVEAVVQLGPGQVLRCRMLIVVIITPNPPWPCKLTRHHSD